MLSTGLAALRKNVLSESLTRLTLATGNQSGDLDSVVCAIVHSFMANRASSRSVTVPFLNFYKKDLGLRKDVVLCLKDAKIDPESLFYVDDLSSAAFKGRIESVHLVDHNVPQGSVSEFLVDNPQVAVTGIIDHHEDEGRFLDASPRLIQVCGSCSSLVWQFWNQTVHGMDNESVFEIMKLLSAPLLLDTSNCTSKMEEPDWLAIDSYKTVLSRDVSFIGLDAWFGALQTARTDIDGLPVRDILNKDYKLFRCQIGTSETPLKIGFSSVIKPLEWIIEQQKQKGELGSSLLSEALGFIKDQGIDALAIMTASVNPATDEFQRQLVFITNSLQTSLLLRLVINSISEELQLEEYSIDELSQEDELPFIKTYSQNNVRASRKQVAPLVKAALREL